MSPIVAGELICSICFLSRRDMPHFGFFSGPPPPLPPMRRLAGQRPAIDGQPPAVATGCWHLPAQFCRLTSVHCPPL